MSKKNTDSNKKTLLKTLSLEAFHLIGVAGVLSVGVYIATGKWEYEYAALGALAYIFWEALGYYIHERVWVKFGKRVK